MRLKNLSWVTSFALMLWCLPGVGEAPGYVVHAMRKIRMSAKEPMAEKEYLTTLGSDSGVRVGDLLAVERWVGGVNDIWGARGPVVQVAVANLRVVAVSPEGSLTRHEVLELSGVGSGSGLQYSQVMIGDEVRRKIPFAKGFDDSIK